MKVLADRPVYLFPWVQQAINWFNISIEKWCCQSAMEWWTVYVKMIPFNHKMSAEKMHGDKDPTYNNTKQ